MAGDARSGGGRELTASEGTHGIRRAGTGLMLAGGRVTWTVADGARGRRWRSMVTDGGLLAGTMLLETGPGGAVLKLELATAAGLLTVHPEGGSLHGNVARPGGMEHIDLPWSDGHILIVVGTPATAAAATGIIADLVGVGEGHTIAGVGIDIGLSVRPVTYRVVRPAARRWRFVPADGGPETAVTVDDAGVPILDEAVSWPLEADTHA